MNLNLLQMKSIRLLFGLFLVLAVILGNVQSTKAAFDKPELPRLSLSGNDQWDDKWYPDGRIWLPAAANGPREFLLPVFVENRWHVYENTKNIYQPDPIKSFSFTLLYNNTAVRPVSIEASWPMKDEQQGYLPLANSFQLSWYDNKDWDYGKYLEPVPPFDTYSKGRAITITGTSTTAMPNTDLQGTEFKVLLYIRFRVVPQDGIPMGNAQFTPLYIKGDTIMWNDHNVRTQAPFKNLRPEYNGRDVTTDYPDPTAFTGLAGVDNRPATTTWNAGWRMLPGVIYLRISDNVPAFGWLLQRGIGTIPPVTEVQPELWDLADPITLDSGSINPFYGKRVVQITNKVSASRLLDVEVESDQPWLTFRTLSGPSYKTPNQIPQPTRHGYINYIDNGILGDAARGTPLPSVSTATDGEIQLELRCNPNNLTDPPQLPNAEQCGIYVGYITLKSHTALINPVKLRVTFIYFRPPFEENKLVQKPLGIELDIYNSNAPVGDSTRLIFGTGHRATNAVDSLFGEYAYPYDMAGFEARWYPPKSSPAELKAKILYGFGDFSPDDDDNDGTPKRSNSRDIRSINDTNQSITYYCKIKEDNVNHYPLILEWDVADFPDGAQLFLKDAVNGLYFPDIDMRKANAIGQTRRSFTIQDARVKEFIIEYTLPRVINYVDDFGAPIIKEGWNLLSLPVRPINAKWSVVYPNAMNRPYFFSQNNYQDDDQLRVGTGYFIKYAAQVDTKFAGTYINEIKVDGTPYDSIKVYTGWNTIGCVSTPLNVRDIEFSPFMLNLPSQNFTRAAGVWGYKTNRGYEEVSEIRPGLGYWLKCDQQGFLSLTAQFKTKTSLNDFVSPREAGYAQSAKLTVKDNAQNSAEVFFGGKNVSELSYELPPAPPVGIFDVRFNQGTKLTTGNNSVIKLQGVTYPTVLNMDNADANYKFFDAATGELLGEIAKGTAGIVELKKAGSGAIRVQKLEVENPTFFISNYPNPVVSATTVNFGITEDANVTVKVYNQMGQEIGTVVNGPYKAGTYSETLNATNYASGSYMLKIFAGNSTAVQTMTVIK